MVTSNKAGVGSLAPFLPLGFLASPTPTTKTWWPCTCRRGLWWMCFLAQFQSPISGLWLEPGVWVTAVAALVCRAERYSTWTRCHRCATSGWLLGTVEAWAAYRFYDLVTGVFVLGAAITCSSWWMIAVWVLGLRNGSTFCFVHGGSRERGCWRYPGMPAGLPSACALWIQGASLPLLPHNSRVRLAVERGRNWWGAGLLGFGVLLHRCCRSWDSIVKLYHTDDVPLFDTL